MKPSLLHIEAHMLIDLHDVCRTRRVAIPSVSIECTIVDDEATLRLLDQPVTPFTIAQSAKQYTYNSQPLQLLDSKSCMVWKFLKLRFLVVALLWLQVPLLWLFRRL